MRTILLVGLSGDEKGRVRILNQDVITFGTTPGQDVDISALYADSVERPAVAQLVLNGGGGRLLVNDPSLQVEIRTEGARAVQTEGSSARVNDGDRLELIGPAARAAYLVQILPEEYQVASLIKAEQAMAQPHRNVHPVTATLFVKELVRSLWAEVGPRRRRQLMLVGLGVVALLIGYVGYDLSERYRSRGRLEQLAAEIERIRQERERESAELQQQKQEFETRLNSLNYTQSLAERIGQQYRPGVCLIIGGYTYVDRKTGRELRYTDANDAGEPLGNDQGFPASIDGVGPVVVEEFTGTGFLVDKGVLLTNRHVVQPWWHDDVSQRIMGDGFQPRMNRLVAYFPAVRVAFPLEVKRLSTNYDVAVCSFDQDGYAIPELPLGSARQEPRIGETVVLLGYPAGIDGLLQRVEEGMRNDITRRAGNSVEQVTKELAELGQVRPLITQGNVTDQVKGRIVHSAPTTEGGSGGPLFDREGKVIGINSAVLLNPATNQEFAGSNFGIPIEHGLELLRLSKAAPGR